jgi:hypothetical protein
MPTALDRLKSNNNLHALSSTFEINGGQQQSDVKRAQALIKAIVET